MTTEGTRVDAEKLREFTAEALQKLGVPEEDARITAQILVDNDLRGVESHGVGHLAGMYAKRIRSGVINLNPNIQIYSEAPSTATIDGDQGLGFVVGHRAMTEAIERAKKTGAGFVAVRNNTHCGAAGSYAMMALEHDMIGFAVVATASAGVVPPGSTKAAFGTNPLAVAAPAGRTHPFLLDMATSVIAAGKLEVYGRLGKPIPAGWLVNGEGRPVTDLTKRVRGEGGLAALGGTAELGGYKGFGLGVLVDILGGVLSGGSASITRKVTPGPAGGNANDNLFGALRIDTFLPLDKYKESMDAMVEAIEALPTVPEVDKLYVAGGIEAKLIEDRKANGIPIHAKVADGLKELAGELGIEYNL